MSQCLVAVWQWAVVGAAGCPVVAEVEKVMELVDFAVAVDFVVAAAAAAAVVVVTVEDTEV